MQKTLYPILDVETRSLQDLAVIHHFLLFHDRPTNPDRLIRPAFKGLRERLVQYGLNPDELLHVGIPDLADQALVSYECCIEFPLPGCMEDIKTLPGGLYAILRVEKIRSKIGPAIRAFRGDYLPEHELIIDEDRPVYEIYFKETMEYCVPIR
jgi:hypothetical protein